jgi:hypothetical protein
MIGGTAAFVFCLLLLSQAQMVEMFTAAARCVFPLHDYLYV